MAKIEHAVVVLRVAAMEGVGKGRLSGSSGSNNDDPWVGKVWDTALHCTALCTLRQKI